MTTSNGPPPPSTLPPLATYPDLRGKVALITGIGNVGDQSMWGNGAATARALAHNGVAIYGCDLNIKAAEHTASRLRAEIPDANVTVTTADVTKSDQVENLVSHCLSLHGRIDILINNVGLSQPGSAASMPEPVWDAQVSVNLKSVYLLCHAVLPHMERHGRGSIVNLSSIAARGYIGKAQIAYNATKAAIIAFTKATAVLYAPRGVRMNAILPGLIHTPLVGVLAEKYNDGDYEGLVKRRGEAVPMGRMGESCDVANAAVFLVSECARYVTGAELLVDGGITSTTGWQSG